MRTLLILATELVAVSHLSFSIVLFIYARRSVAFKAQAWILMLIALIFGASLALSVIYSVPADLGILNPYMLIFLLVTSFLLSINPLGMVMPGYLQVGRMVRYASPAIVVVSLYVLGLLAGSEVVRVGELSDLPEVFLSSDIILRICALLLSFGYIVNIIFVPHLRLRRKSLPKNIVTYAMLLGIVQLMFVVCTIRFSLPLLIVYEILFASVSVMLCGCIIKPLMQAQPYPEIRKVDVPPTNEEISVLEEEDFNEANLFRFERVEYVMQHEKPYVSPDFNRDRLCRLSGFNRHLLLQTVRSQGYNDVHDYISRYRVKELRSLIAAGIITDLRQHDRVGFRTLKTAALAFERYEHTTLAAFLAAAVGEQAVTLRPEAGEAWGADGEGNEGAGPARTADREYSK